MVADLPPSKQQASSASVPGYATISYGSPSQTGAIAGIGSGGGGGGTISLTNFGVAGAVGGGGGIGRGGEGIGVAVGGGGGNGGESPGLALSQIAVGCIFHFLDCYNILPHNYLCRLLAQNGLVPRLYVVLKEVRPVLTALLICSTLQALFAALHRTAPHCTAIAKPRRQLHCKPLHTTANYHTPQHATTHPAHHITRHPAPPPTHTHTDHCTAGARCWRFRQPCSCAHQATHRFHE